MSGYRGPGNRAACGTAPAFWSIRTDCGLLDGNPVHEENTWIARRAGCDFIVNVVIDSERRPLKFVAGDMEQAFLEGVAFVRGVVTDTLPAPADIVVTIPRAIHWTPRFTNASRA